jgi:hypothetical protein
MSMAGVRKGSGWKASLWAWRANSSLEEQHVAQQVSGERLALASQIGGVILETNTGFVSEQC